MQLNATLAHGCSAENRIATGFITWMCYDECIGAKRPFGYLILNQQNPFAMQMKKFLLIVAVILIALIALTSCAQLQCATYSHYSKKSMHGTKVHAKHYKHSDKKYR